MRLLSLVILIAGCRLGPLVEDEPGASVHVLPAGTVVPHVEENAELVSQIALNDGLDDRSLMMSGGLIARGTGWSGGAQVSLWSFGTAARAPAPVYVFGTTTASGFQPSTHPYLLAALPGDPGYGPVLSIQHVPLTAAYDGELITSLEALSDARELGLVEEPIPAEMFFNGPVVAPGTTLEVGGGRPPPQPQIAFARGYRVDMFQLGGMLGRQPLGALVPTNHVSLLREAMKATYDGSRPILQATVPTAPPTMRANYTPLSIVIHVDLAPGIEASTIISDADLFTRSAQGGLTGTTAAVSTFTVTTTIQNLQLQFVEGAP